MFLNSDAIKMISTIVTQPIFILDKAGSNLDKNNIIFTIKNLMSFGIDLDTYFTNQEKQEDQKTIQIKNYWD